MPHPEIKKKKIDPNLLVAIGVLLSSFAALLIYTRQAQIMNKQTEILMEQMKASVWPHLTIGRSNSDYPDDGFLRIFIKNRGSGPAIIEKVIVSFDGEAVSDWKEFYKAIDLPSAIPISHANENIRDQVLAANETIDLIEWRNKNSRQFLPLLKKVSDKISISICYQSIYGDKWVVKRDGFLTDLEPNVRSRQEECASQGVREFIQ